MVICKAPFLKLEAMFVASPDWQRTLRVLSSPAVYQLNVAVYRKLYQIKNYYELSYDKACDTYNAFLDETNGHPVYTTHPYLAAFCMFEKLPIAQGVKGPFIVDYEPKRTQKIKYLNEFGQEESVKVPEIFKGYTRSTGPAKPIPNYKDGELTISLENALVFVSRHIRNEYDEGQAYRDEVMQVRYKSFKERQKPQSAEHFDFLCGFGCEANVTVGAVKPSKQSVASVYEEYTAAAIAERERPSTHSIVVGSVKKPSKKLAPKNDTYVRSIQKGKVKIMPSVSAKGPSQPFLTNFYLPYRLSSLKVPSV